FNNICQFRCCFNWLLFTSTFNFSSDLLREFFFTISKEDSNEFFITVCIDDFISIQTQSLDAYEIVNTYSYEELVRIFFRYGEEKFSKQIAREIESRRKDKRDRKRVVSGKR